MNARILLVALLTSLFTVACGGSDALMQPSSVTDVAAVHGLLRERNGDFVEFATESFEALYDAETVRAPEWSVTGGTLMGNGNSARWQLPRAGRHTITLKIFLVDGREVEASWTVNVVAWKGEVGSAG
ncbi:MAG: hypothetical protein JNJ54_37200 [Myxococcaceae bacterium]|nr:hypothetical protein [Myxococcaceae bacterium]